MRRGMEPLPHDGVPAPTPTPTALRRPRRFRIHFRIHTGRCCCARAEPGLRQRCPGNRMCNEARSIVIWGVPSLLVWRWLVPGLQKGHHTGCVHTCHACIAQHQHSSVCTLAWHYRETQPRSLLPHRAGSGSSWRTLGPPTACEQQPHGSCLTCQRSAVLANVLPRSHSSAGDSGTVLALTRCTNHRHNTVIHH